MRILAVVLALASIGASHKGCNPDDLNPCKGVKCPEGQHCKVQETWPPTAKCVPLPEPSPSPSLPPTPSPSPSPSPNPTPVPSPTLPPSGCTIDPATGNYPIPIAGTCPGCFADSLAWWGTAYRGRTAINPQGGTYIGWRYKWDGTPHSVPPYCGHAPGNRCQQWEPDTGAGCQQAPEFWMKRAGGWPNDGGIEWTKCDRFSNNPFYCHHKAKWNETGLTTTCAVKFGEGPPSDLSRCSTVDVQP